MPHFVHFSFSFLVPFSISSVFRDCYGVLFYGATCGRSDAEHAEKKTSKRFKAKHFFEAPENMVFGNTESKISGICIRISLLCTRLKYDTTLQEVWCR